MSLKNLTLALFVLIGASPAALALQLQVSAKDLNKDQVQQAQQATSDVMAALPEVVKQALQYTIEIQFEKASSTKDNVHLGMASMRAKRIWISDAFLRPQSKQEAESGVFTPIKLRKVIAHEVAHFYDHLNLARPELRAQEMDCNAKSMNSEERNNLSDMCKYFLFKRTTLSDDPEFLAITGWSQGEFINKFHRRLTDYYASTSREETFPVLMEAYLFDSDFACRMPVANSFFNRHFKENRTSSCRSKMTWYMSAEEEKFRTIERRQIWAVDYFWAAEGKGQASGFGHAMIRLVVCAPERTPGPDCYKDFEHHIILSFAASSQAMDFGTMAGLTGKYPLNLFAISFFQSKTTYNITELRDIYSVPLNMTDQQKNRLIDSLYEAHWTFNSQYYFTSRNCASEVARLLMGSGIPVDLAFYLKSVTPSDLLWRLLNSPLSKYKNRKEMEKDRLVYFPSVQKNVDVALSIVSKSSGVKMSDMDDYMDGMTNPVFEKTFQEAGRDRRLLTAVYYLEKIRWNRLRAKMAQEQLEKEPKTMDQIKKAVGVGAESSYEMRFMGEFLTSDHYGIPDEEEVAVAQKKMIDFFESLKEKNKDLITSTRETLSSLAASLLDSSQRYTRLVEALNQK